MLSKSEFLGLSSTKYWSCWLHNDFSRTALGYSCNILAGRPCGARKQALTNCREKSGVECTTAMENNDLVVPAANDDANVASAGAR
jgi:hypothetical protein